MAEFQSPDAHAVLTFSGAEDFEAWLEHEHAQADGVWIAMAKKKSGIESIAWPEAVEVALCFGWIDGQRRAHDETYFLQRFTPRRSRSPWSRINRDKAEELIAAGRMRPAGLSEVKRAQDDGRWDAAYEGSRTISVPEDLQRELDADPGAAKFFETLSSQNRYSILYRLGEAKKPETRARRLTKFVEMLRNGETVHPQ
jgi:uncharacterized protein YdeI (YjbR/CyaY-like superfamily)